MSHRPAPSKSNKQIKTQDAQIEIEVHTRFDRLSEKEEDNMDTSPRPNAEDSSSEEGD